jgi:lauroyl/myristoyl acyltransferase
VSERRSTLAARLLRSLEPLFPVAGYLALLYPIAFVRAVIHQVVKKPAKLVLPSFLNTVLPPQRLPRLSTYLNRTFEFIPDRLDSAKWQARCRYVGFQPVHEALDEGRPVIFTFAHFGQYGLLRNWLRSAGIPVATVSGGSVSNRSNLLKRKDRWAISSNVPAAFHLDQLTDAVRHFKNGVPLAMAFDVAHRRQVSVPLPDGWAFNMATGTIRLAKKHHARLFPCTIYSHGSWKFTIEAFPAVPEEILTQGDQNAAHYILEKLLPVFEQHSDQWELALLKQFVPPPNVCS